MKLSNALVGTALSLLVSSCAASSSAPQTPAVTETSASVSSSNTNPTGSAAATQAIVCNSDERPVSVVLKESFRTSTTPRDGTHRYFELTGCESDTAVRATVQVGREDDASYTDATPTPIAGTVVTLPFQGTYDSQTLITHGTQVNLVSSDQSISVTGDFYSNRDIQYVAEGITVPASLIATN